MSKNDNFPVSAAEFTRSILPELLSDFERMCRLNRITRALFWALTVPTSLFLCAAVVVVAANGWDGLVFVLQFSAYLFLLLLIRNEALFDLENWRLSKSEHG